MSVAIASIATDTPIGSVLMWLINTPPDGWLLVNGSTFDGTTYPDLAAYLGGTTLPDMRFRFPLGAYPDAPFLTNPLVLGGTNSHSHTQPTHTHTGPDHNHTITHTHAIDPPSTASNSAGGHTHDNHTSSPVGILSLLSSAHTGPTTHSSDGSHTHTTDIASFTSGGSSAANTGNAGTGNTGASGGDNTNTVNHNPPFITVNFIIRAI